MKKVVFVLLVLALMLAAALPVLADGYCPRGFLQVDAGDQTWGHLFDGTFDKNDDGTMCVKIVNKRYPGGGGEERVIASIDNVVPVATP